MPSPKEEETKKKFVSRCIPIVIKEGADQDHAIAKCNGIWRQSLKKKLEAITLEGPTILGAAMTNRPHIKGLPEIAYDEEKGKVYIPLLRKGKFRHHTGLLEFNDKVFRQMIENFDNNVVGTKISIDNRHKPEIGANAWIEKVFVNDKGLLIAECEPTPPGLEAIKNKQYRYASIEFARNWSSPEIRFSSDELSEYNEEEEMPENVTLEQYQEEVRAREAIEAQLEEIETKSQEQITASNAQIAQLQADHLTTVARLEAQVTERMINGIILEAESYRDEKGHGHPKALVNWASSVMRFESIGEGDEVISLEDRESVGKTRAYIRKSVAVLLSTLPGAVPLKSDKTVPDKTRTVENDVTLESGEYTEAEEKLHKSFWEV